MIPFLFVGCGGGLLGLSLEEQQYADAIAATATSQLPPAQAHCIGNGLVRFFGLARAKELELASTNISRLAETDAHRVVDVLEHCVNIREIMFRLTKAELGLDDAGVARCGKLVEPATARRWLLTIYTSTSDQASKSLAGEINPIVRQCKG
jgi:hypothetical protein